MNKIDLDYQRLLRDILKNGVKKSDRTGTGTLSVFGRQIRHSMADGFPLLTTKKMYFKGIVTELLWFLRGETNIQWLVQNDCHIWTGDAYKKYCNDCESQEYMKEVDLELPLPNKSYGLYTQKEFTEKIKTDDVFAKKWGDLGRVYGEQWRNWNSELPFGEATSSLDVGIDQIANLINDLKNDPDSRRLLVTAWNPVDVPNSVLPPCHIGFQMYTRELSLDERLDLMRKRTVDGTVDYDNRHHGFLDYHNIPKRAISLMWNQRSCDVPLGIPYNIASYALLLLMIAKTVNMVPDELIGNLGDTHIYLNQLDGVNEQLSRDSFDLPTVTISDRVVSDISEYTIDDITLENYTSHPKIYFPLSN